MKGRMMNTLTQICAVTGNISTFYLNNSEKGWVGKNKKVEKVFAPHELFGGERSESCLPACQKKKLKWEKSSKISDSRWFSSPAPALSCQRSSSGTEGWASGWIHPENPSEAMEKLGSGWWRAEGKFPFLRQNLLLLLVPFAGTNQNLNLTLLS